MRFVPKQPEEGINVGKTHPLVEASTLIVGLTAILLSIILLLIFLVEIALWFIPAEKEAQMFEDWLPEDIVTVAPHDDRLVATQNLTDRLARHWPDSPYEFRVEIDDSDVSNAMALPGGLIIVTAGLLDEVESENELAFVLAHEIGHYRNRDHMRALGRLVVISIALAASQGGDSSGIGVNVADMTIRSFSRRQESRADRYALMLVQSQYGHVDEAWRLFDRWDEQTGDDSSQLISYLSTHPHTGARITELEAIAVA